MEKFSIQQRDEPVSASIVITTYNDAEYLHQAIDSLLSQTVLPAEIIIVDDGSANDMAESMVKKHFPETAFIRFVKKINGGPSSARNLGVALATSDYVAFLDVDDAWLPDNLENKLNQFKSCSASYFGVYGSFLSSNTGRPTPFMICDGKPPVDKIGMPTGFPGGAPAYLFRRSALFSVGGFDESLSINEDFDLLLRLIKDGWLCKGDATPGFVRNRREGSLTRNDKLQVNYQRINDFLDKAERCGYFTAKEIIRRRKLNNLVLARALKAAKQPACEIKSALQSAFKQIGPVNTKEWLAYFYMKVL